MGCPQGSLGPWGACIVREEGAQRADSSPSGREVQGGSGLPPAGKTRNRQQRKRETGVQGPLRDAPGPLGGLHCRRRGHKCPPPLLDGQSRGGGSPRSPPARRQGNHKKKNRQQGGPGVPQDLPKGGSLRGPPVLRRGLPFLAQGPGGGDPPWANLQGEAKKGGPALPLTS